MNESVEKAYNDYVSKVASDHGGWGTSYMLGYAVVNAALIIGKAIIAAAYIGRSDK